MKKVILKSTVLILIFSSYLNAQQQESWTTFTTADGLAHKCVKVIVETSDGELWFGTYEGGVSRYSPGIWPTFTTEDGLADNYVTAIIEGTDGTLWFGTEEGVSRYSQRSWTTFTTDSGLASNSVRAIVKDSDGILWFGTDRGVSRYSQGSWATFTTADGLADDVVNAIVEASDGALWFGTWGGGVSRYSQGNWTTFNADNSELAYNHVNAIVEASDGALWFGTYEGISRYSQGSWTTFNTGNSELAYDHVSAILEASDGALWFGTWGGGVSRYYQASWITFKTAAYGLAHNQVNAIVETSDRALWFGTWGGGVSHYSQGNWTTFTTDSGLAYNYVRAIIEASDGTLWFGTWGKGVSRYSQGSWTTFTTANGLTNNYLNRIVETSDGALWFGTEGGVSRYSLGSWTTFKTTDGLSSDSVLAIMEASNGALWFGTERGVTRYYQGSWTTITTDDGLTNNYVRAIVEAFDGALWFGTWGGGVSRYSQGSWLSFNTTNELAYVRTIVEASDGALWFGTGGGGVCRYYQGSWINFTTADGLADNNVRAIIEASDGALWFGTWGGGVNRLSPDRFPPQTYINKGPEKITGTSIPWFIFGGQDNYTKQNQLLFAYVFKDMDNFPVAGDSSIFTNETAVQPSPPLDNGTYTFYVWTRDEWLKIDPTPASRTFTVDNTSPTATIEYPKDEDIISDIVTIKGTVYDYSPLKDFDYYSIFYGKGEEEKEVIKWDTLVCENRDRDTIRNDSLATWDTRGLRGDYLLKLLAKDTLEHVSEDVIKVQIVDANQQIISSQGGYVRDGQNKVEIYFPPNSISENQEIQIINVSELVKDTSNITPGTSFGFIYDIKPKNLQLSKPGVLTITYADANLTNENRLSILRYDENNKTWDLVGGTVDKAQQKISTSINQLGRYGLFEYSGDDAKLAVSDVNCQPRIFSPKGGGYDTRVAISFKLGKSTNVTIKIYNAAGRLADVLKENQSFTRGNNVVYWDGKDKWGNYCDSGLYIVLIESGEKTATKTCMVLNE